MILILLALIVVAIHGYLWLRLFVSPWRRDSRIRRVGAIGLAAIAVLALAGVTADRAEAIPRSVRQLLEAAGYLWIAAMLYLLLWLAGGELLRVGVAAVRPWRRMAVGNKVPSTPSTAGKRLVDGEPGGDASADGGPVGGPTGMDRRLLLSRGIALAAGVGALGTVGYGMTEAFGDFDLTHVPITLDKLAPALSGFRIGLVSDIHIGAYVGRSRVAEIVRVLNGQRLDLVAIVGDLVDDSVAELGDAAPLQRLRSREGTYFVTGNHEYVSGVRQWLSYLPRLGITMLRNQRVTIERGEAAFELAGVNDISADRGTYGGDGYDLRAALAGRNRNIPLVLLAHQPVVFGDAADAGVDLQLSGHTHGGQLAPFGWLIKAQQGILSGYRRRGHSQLYVTRGTGLFGPPVRIGAPPEITVIELRSRQ